MGLPMMLSKECADCKHYIGLKTIQIDEKEEGQTFDICSAYPDGIPDVIIDGIKSHKDPIEGDRGIQYEPREE